MASNTLSSRKYVLVNNETGMERACWNVRGYLALAVQVAPSYIHGRYKHNSDLPTGVLIYYMQQLRVGADRLLEYPLTAYDNLSVYASMLLLTLEQLENMTDNNCTEICIIPDHCSSLCGFQI